MLRILVVEDEPEKRQLLTQAICNPVNISLDNVLVADNVRDAKRLLSQYHFDLVVLDLNVPRTAAAPPEKGAGLDVLAYIKNNTRAIAPAYVFGLTAYEDSFAEAADAFESALWKVMRFSYSDASWNRALRAALEYLISRQTPPYVTDGRTHHCDVAIAVALEEELQSILALPGSWRKITVLHDHAQYYAGVASFDGRSLSIVASVASRMGMSNMAATSMKMVTAFHPKLIATSGLCAGVREKTRIGDVLVADPCFDWGSGKWVRENKKSPPKFLPAAYQWRLDARLATAARHAGNDDGFLRDLYISYVGDKPPDPPQVLVDAMASGGSVLQVEELMADVRGQHKNLIGVEMESYALFSVAQDASEPRPLCIAIKSVCDFGDEEKNDKYRPYASYTSARFLWNLLGSSPVLEILGGPA